MKFEIWMNPWIEQLRSYHMPSAHNWLRTIRIEFAPFDFFWDLNFNFCVLVWLSCRSEFFRISDKQSRTNRQFFTVNLPLTSKLPVNFQFWKEINRFKELNSVFLMQLAKLSVNKACWLIECCNCQTMWSEWTPFSWTSIRQTSVVQLTEPLNSIQWIPYCYQIFLWLALRMFVCLNSESTKLNWLIRTALGPATGWCVLFLFWFFVLPMIS